MTDTILNDLATNLFKHWCCTYIFVIFRDGISRCGVFCASSICCDQLKAEGEVDIFNAVRIIKKNRPELVPNVVSYRHWSSSYHYFVSRDAMRGLP